MEGQWSFVLIVRGSARALSAFILLYVRGIIYRLLCSFLHTAIFSFCALFILVLCILLVLSRQMHMAKCENCYVEELYNDFYNQGDCNHPQVQPFGSCARHWLQFNSYLKLRAVKSFWLRMKLVIDSLYVINVTYKLFVSSIIIDRMVFKNDFSLLKVRSSEYFKPWCCM